MTDWNALTAGLGLAGLGGLLIALTGRRWQLSSAPTLEAGQRVELTIKGHTYATLLAGTEGDTLLLTPPLQRGLPLTFEVGTHATLRLTTPNGLYGATIEFTGRHTKPTAQLLARRVSRWHHLQRRRHERITLPDEVQVALRHANEQWIGWICNLSRGGACLHAPVAFAVNNIVHLELPTALRGLSRTPERLARVVACERAPTRYGYAYRVRLSFLDG